MNVSDLTDKRVQFLVTTVTAWGILIALVLSVTTPPVLNVPEAWQMPLLGVALLALGFSGLTGFNAVTTVAKVSQAAKASGTTKV
jgi:hypothetical protein